VLHFGVINAVAVEDDDDDEWMNEHDLSDAITETVAGALNNIIRNNKLRFIR